MISVRALRVVYGHTVALDSIDLRLEPGVTGVFGPNGSGKTTLLRAVAGLLRPVTGGIELDGAPVAVSNEGFRRRVGYAGHGSGLYAQLSVIENLELFARLYGVAPHRPTEMIESVGLGEHAGKRVIELSAGLKRRAAVARALLHEPDVLLLDEPYANLDDEASELISESVRTWNGPRRVALIATHGAKRLKGWADAGVVLRDGRVVSAGSYRPGTGFEPDAAHARPGRAGAGRAESGPRPDRGVGGPR